MGDIDKMFAPLGGLPLLAHCLNSYNESPSVHSISVATSPRSVERVKELIIKHDFDKVECVVAGGARRQDSVLNALLNLDGSDIVLIHDGARPFIDEEVIERAVAVARESAAGTAAVPVKDTIKVVNPDMSVRETPSRESLWAAQTPQSFSYDLIIRSHAQIERDVTDDATMVEAVGHPVKLFMGSYDNIKVTTPEDLHIAEAILRSRREAKAN